VPQWGGGGGSGGGSFSGNNYYPINWLNANVYAIPRYTPAGILGFFTGVSSFGGERKSEEGKRATKKKKGKEKTHSLSFFLFPFPQRNFSLSTTKQIGSTQAVIIVLDNWEAKVVGWVRRKFFLFLFFLSPWCFLIFSRREKKTQPFSKKFKKQKKNLSLSHTQGPTPVYRAPPVGYTFSWGFYEYLWYANTYGSWGWKSPPLWLTMYGE
jgi:hypothetical protein